MIKKIIDWFDEYFSRDDKERVHALLTIISLKEIIISNQEDLIEGFEVEREELINKIADKVVEEELERYWNDKRPKSNMKYLGRPAIKGSKNLGVDPRIFFQNDCYTKKISGDSFDEIAMNSLKYVIRTIAYIGDERQFKTPEVWLFPFETQSLRRGDCEDGAILLANILLASGVPYWRLRLNAGDVNGGGHCWLTYLREEDNQWYVLDWCYWKKESLKWLRYKDAENYYSIWFSWNNKFLYKNDDLDRK